MCSSDLAIQLAKLSGANVTALIRRETARAAVIDAGADHVVVGEVGAVAAVNAPYHCIIDSVGGQVLSDCLQQIARGGILVNFGTSAGGTATVDVGAFFRTGRARYYGLYVFTEFGRRPARNGLGVLLDLLAAGKLNVHIDAQDNLAGPGGLAERRSEERRVGQECRSRGAP